jgi:hypothetical protein
MILPTGRSRTVLLGAAVLAVVTVAFFLVFDIGTVSGSSRELPVIRIGQVDPQPGEDQAQPAAAASDAAGSSAAPATSRGTSSNATVSSGTTSRPSGGYTDTTTREYVQEGVRVQDHWPTTTSTDGWGDWDGSSNHRPRTGRR